MKKIILDEYAVRPDEKRKKAAINEIILMTATKKHRVRLTPFQRIMREITLIPLWFWIAQAAALASVCVLRPDGMAVVMAAPAISALAFCTITRSFCNGMWELERACRYDLRSMLLYRLVIIGTVDLAVITAASAMCGGFGFTRCLLYSLTVFALTNLSCMFIFGRVRDKSMRLYGVIAAASILFSVAVLNGIGPGAIDIFADRYVGAWAFVLAALIAVGVFKLNKIYSEELSWSLQ